MQVLQTILAVFGGVTVVALGVVAACWKLIDSTLTAWLTKRVTRQLERDAEQYRHALARDMETYKDELNRVQSIERLRAEMRKTVAEKMFAIRLDAYHMIYAMLETVPAWIATRLQLPAAARGPLSVATEKLMEFGNAVERNSLYLPLRFSITYRRYAGLLYECVEEIAWANAEPLPFHHNRIIAILEQAGALQREINDLHRALPDDLANSIAHPDFQQPEREAD
jgi:hypothetical protein